MIACGIACNREIPQATYEHASRTFVRGDLKQSQEEAARGYERFHDPGSVWAWKFRILESKSLLWRGMYRESLNLIDAAPTPPQDKESQVEVLAISGAAKARLHEFAAAEADLLLARESCEAFSVATCGEAIRSAGVLAIQRGQVDSAKQFFEQSLQFARTHQDRFLEVTALLNSGLASLQAQHFDEAIERTGDAYQAALRLGADGEAQTALGNLGWAYYNVGDSERSLELSLEAAKRAGELGRIIGQLSWITNVGYVYANLGDFVRAKESYLRALELATKIGGQEDIYNAYRALALVTATSGDSNEASQYCDKAMAIAKAGENRLDQLYLLLVKGLIAARSHALVEAERSFHEVERDPVANAPLKWISEHQLAQLYAAEARAGDADRSYRAALATFEAARSSLRHNDVKLPFSNNASGIYDDYIHFLVERGQSDDALRWADNSRARALTDGLGLLSPKVALAPPPLNAPTIARHLVGNILFYWLGEKQSYLWVITPQGTGLRTLPPGHEIEEAIRRYRNALSGPQEVLATANSDGRWLYTTLLAPVAGVLPRGSKVFVVPDGGLNNLNFETLVAPGPSPHYWIEDATVINVSSIKVLAASTFSNKPRARNLLLIGNSVAPNDKYPELPKAQAQMDGVATHFDAASRRVLAREQATPAAYLSSNPSQFSYIHFVAHGTASRLSPLDSAIILSKGSAESDSFKLYARDIIRQPLRADVVTISSCYGAGERTYAGEGLVGLSWAFLRAGAHNVVAALWEATDASTEQLMEKFYDELKQGATPDVALHSAKLFLLKNTAFHNPFYWAPFQLYAGS